MSETEAPIKPYQGPPATPDTFAEAFPEIVRQVTAPRRGINPLDATSQQNLDDLFRQMRNTPPKPATVINLHPWPLSFGAADKFLRGVVVPACNPGMEFAYHHIRTWSADRRYSEDCMSSVFTAILPIHKAGQFLRQFSDPEVYGGGVLIYQGEGHPNKVGKVETYSQDGRPITNPRKEREPQDEGADLEVIREVPVMRELSEMIADQRRRRNEFYLNAVQWADERFKSTDAKERKLVTPIHRMMAEMLVSENWIPTAPDWNLTSRLEQGLADNNCKSCGNVVQKAAYKCSTCENILNPLEAYMDHAIEIDHAKMDTLTAEQWKDVEKEEEKRDKARQRREKLAKKPE